MRSQKEMGETVETLPWGLPEIRNKTLGDAWQVDNNGQRRTRDVTPERDTYMRSRMLLSNLVKKCLHPT